jgi:cytochrome c5
MLRVVLTSLVLLAATAPALVRASEGAALTGEQIYRQSCAHCHGDKGQGVKDEYKEPLVGDRSIKELARLIAKTMPKDDAGTCTGEEADKVAAYVFDAFYSPAAQLRNQPPRIELARLTVRQYRNAVTDLLGSFRGEPRLEQERGLKGEYFKSRNFNKNERIIERVDSHVLFDFGEASPDPSKQPEGNEFSIRWEGSLQAPVTGEYNILIRTEHATRLWLNDQQRPLIDAWVKSGDDNEYRGTIYLLGGRVYPLKLEFSKAKQGVDDSKKNKPKPTKASIALLWQLPHRPVQVIPARHLTPQRFPETFAVTTAFPADDRSVGYERGTSISKEWDQATTDAALETAAYVSKKLNDLAGTNDKDGEREKKLREFCARFAERAFRRPLSEEQRALYVDRQFAEAKDHETAVKRVVLFVLKSPRFLYQQPITGQADDFVIAERLAMGLWDSLPDQQLRDAAAQGKLKARDEVRRQAERMATDQRAQFKLRAFFEQWLRLDHVTEISKDPAGYPEFNAEFVADLRTSLDLFLNEIITSDSADFRQLLLSDSLYLNGRLAKFYGADLPADAPFQKVALQADQRAGVLTHPLLMSGFAYTSTSSPIHRGVFVSRNVLGRALKQPPEAVAPLPADLHADLNTRERVALQTKGEMCQGCHAMINPLGFTFERFDAVGRLRDQEKGKAIDAHGSYELRSGEVRDFEGARPLGEFLASSEESHSALVAQLFHYLVKQPIHAYGPNELSQLRQQFAENQFNLRRLMVDIVVSAALHDAQNSAPSAEGT